MFNDILPFIISGLIGASIGAFLTNYYKEKFEKKKRKCIFANILWAICLPCILIIWVNT